MDLRTLKIFCVVSFLLLVSTAPTHGFLNLNDEEATDPLPELRPLQAGNKTVDSLQVEMFRGNEEKTKTILKLKDELANATNTLAIVKANATHTIDKIQANATHTIDKIQANATHTIERIQAKIDSLTAELSIYKFRSALEYFEEKFCPLSCSQLKKEAKTILKSDPEETRFTEIDKLFEQYSAKFPMKKSPSVAYKEQIYCRKLKWLWILENRSEEFEVRNINGNLEEKKMNPKNFAEYIGIGYYFLSKDIHYAVFSRLPYPLMTKDLTPLPQVNSALELFLGCYTFKGPSF